MVTHIERGNQNNLALLKRHMECSNKRFPPALWKIIALKNGESKLDYKPLIEIIERECQVKTK